MRKPRQPSYRHHKASGQAVVTIDNVDRYLGKHGTPESHREYDRRIAEWLANGRAIPEDGVTVSGLLLAYKRWAKGYYVKNGKPTSSIRSINHASGPTILLYGKTPAKGFGPSALKAIRQSFIEAGLARSEVNRRTDLIVQAFRWGSESEMIPAETWHALRAVRTLRKGRTEAPERPPVEPVADAHVDAILGVAPSPIRAMIELQRHTGMRPGEVVIMRTFDLKPDRDGPGVWYEPASHKTEHHDRRRIIYLGPRAREVVRKWLRPDDPGRYLFSPRESMIELGALRRAGKAPNPGRRPPKTSRRVGDRYSGPTYRRAISLAIERANKGRRKDGLPEIPHWHPNQIRHTAATMIRHKLDIEAARTVLGHKNASVTEQYAREDLRRAAAAMEELG